MSLPPANDSGSTPTNTIPESPSLQGQNKPLFYINYVDKLTTNPKDFTPRKDVKVQRQSGVYTLFHANHYTSINKSNQAALDAPVDDGDVNGKLWLIIKQTQSCEDTKNQFFL